MLRSVPPFAGADERRTVFRRKCPWILRWSRKKLFWIMLPITLNLNPTLLSKNYNFFTYITINILKILSVLSYLLLFKLYISYNALDHFFNLVIILQTFTYIQTFSNINFKNFKLSLKIFKKLIRGSSWSKFPSYRMKGNLIYFLCPFRNFRRHICARWSRIKYSSNKTMKQMMQPISVSIFNFSLEIIEIDWLLNVPHNFFVVPKICIPRKPDWVRRNIVWHEEKVDHGL